MDRLSGFYIKWLLIQITIAFAGIARQRWRSTLVFYIVICTFVIPLTPAFSQSRCLPCADTSSRIIFCDDFESSLPISERYFGYVNDDGDFIRKEGVGRNGTAGMRVRFQEGEVDAGRLQKFFGRSPYDTLKTTARPLEQFNEIYWRIDVKYEAAWQGGGADKLTRATSLISAEWQQGMIAHLWSGGDSGTANYLVMDPASGVDSNGHQKSTRYNDFPNLRWLGNKKGSFDLFQPANTGRWYCIVAHAKLNAPGKKDGIFEFWIDNKLQAGSYDLNWHGDRNKDPNQYMINAIFIENYWNKGSPFTQERYFDNFVISTSPLICNCNTP